jgi:Fe-S-cluster-containing dehydrogenase component
VDSVALASTGEPVGTMIDLTTCDGCKGKKTPACVTACKTKNQARFPEPVEDIGDYWPQKQHEDWSDKKGMTDRLTPYNWTFVQRVAVEHEGSTHQVAVPRRCMHCDNPPCVKVCPFGAQEKTEEGAVLIDEDLCFGGAKCRDVCAWGIPARQAGVGLYMKLAPKVAGGGVMYKCDLCIDRLRAGRLPACIEACPKQAISIGPKGEMLRRAKAKAEQIGGFLYGEKENGGTSTFYVSPVPFEKINKALLAQKKQQKNPMAPGFPAMPVEVGNFLDSANGVAWGLVVAPLAGVVAAGAAAFRTMKGEDAELGDRVARRGREAEAQTSRAAEDSPEAGTVATLEAPIPTEPPAGDGQTGPRDEGGAA